MVGVAVTGRDGENAVVDIFARNKALWLLLS